MLSLTSTEAAVLLPCGGQTGNLAAVMKAMGHRDVKTAMQYQHPELESVRIIINDRNARHNLRHKTEFLQ
jgi:hypothetical protein